MVEKREPKLGVAVGRKGCGKTYTTKSMMQKYVAGNPLKHVPGRRVLILDVNDEFTDVKALSLSDVKRFSVHPTKEIRRIRPFQDNGKRMTLNEIQNTLFVILDNFRNGLLLIEDINRYISDNLPNDLVGAIVTNRHTDTDIILHFQSIGRITPKIWQNVNWIRFHKNTDSVDKHKLKFEDKFELLKIVEMYIESEYHEHNNKRVYVYIDIDDEKIRGVSRKKIEPIIDEYISENYRKVITPLLNKTDLKGAKKLTPEQAVKIFKTRIMSYYLDM
jgi:hypothetical protein